jgi:hypothetical protein
MELDVAVTIEDFLSFVAVVVAVAASHVFGAAVNLFIGSKRFPSEMDDVSVMSIYRTEVDDVSDISTYRTGSILSSMATRKCPPAVLRI